MPIYEYEPSDRGCAICRDRFEALQTLHEAPLEVCPTCGLPVRRVISRASIGAARGVSPEKAATRGFSTFKKAGGGTWEKVAGDGPETLSKGPEAPKPKKVYDLDAG